MKALSIRQPWAGLIALGIKTIELRSWSTSYRGPLLICASGGQPDDWSYRARDFSRWANEVRFIEVEGLVKQDVCVMRQWAVAVVELEDCLFIPAMPAKTRDRWGEDACVDFTPKSGYAWRFNNARVLKPFRVSGRQRFFDVELPEAHRNGLQFAGRIEHEADERLLEELAAKADEVPAGPLTVARRVIQHPSR